MLVGKAMLAKILRDNEIDPLGQRLDVSKPMPHSLDYFGLEFELTPRA
jgi:hypothetical protein